jgi:hypothetical protein
MIPVAQEHVDHGINSGGLNAEDVKGLSDISEIMEKARKEIAAHRDGLGAKQPREGKP